MDNGLLYAVLAIWVFLLAVEENLVPYLVLQAKLAGITLYRKYLLLWLHPRSPWTRWVITRRANRIARSFNFPPEESRK